MLPCKSTKIISEISDFFTSDEKARTKIMELYNLIKLTNAKLGVAQAEQSKYPKNDLFLLLILFPLYSIATVNDYLSNALSKHLEARKDTFYRFKNNSQVNWRRILYMVNSMLIRQCNTKGSEDESSPRCLIIDDTDLPKTGKKIEHISRIWSHTMQRSILGLKALVLGYWDSKSFIGLDFTIHNEKGKNKKKQYGLTNKELRSQYSKRRDTNSPGYERESELNNTKMDNAIVMIKRVIRHKLPFRYVLMDSWFVCSKMIKAIRKMGCQYHLLGMAKMGKTLYQHNNRFLTAKQILGYVKRQGQIKRHRKLGLRAAETLVYMDNIPLKLIFCQLKSGGSWNLLLTTDTKLSVEKTIQIYSIRWSIEVFFKECKKHFGLGKSQANDFDAQIADTTIGIISFNMFSVARRFTSYETLGELFRETSIMLLEMTICQRLWGLFQELLRIIADIFDVDFEELMQKLIDDDNTKNNKLIGFIQNTLSNAA